MTISIIPLVSLNESSPIVGLVRARLNIPGQDSLDSALAEYLRGVQVAIGLPATGSIDHATLDALGIEL